MDYWGYLSERGVFNAKESLVDYMVEKMPLPEYLRKGLEILEKPVRTETELEDFDEW